MQENDAPVAEILAKNVKALLANKHGPSTQTDLASRSGVAQATIGRILRADSGARIGTVAQIAKVYGLQAWQLLVDGFNPGNPPVLRPLSATEQEFYARLRGAAELLAQMPPGRYSQDPTE